jgi:HlyD family secretion protein
MARIRNTLFATAGLALLLAAPVSHAEEPAKSPAEAEQALPAIMVVAVADRKLTDRVIVTGSILSIEDVYVAPQVDGLQIKALNVDIGDTVKAGDVLAVLNDDALVLQKSQLEANRARVAATGAQVAAQLLEAKANADESVRQAKRNEQLAKSGSVSTAQAELSRAQATAALARVNSAEQAIEGNKADMKVIDTQIADIELRLQRTGVKAPVNGVVTARNAKIGSIASGGAQPMFAIMRDGAVEMQADVAETEILKLRPDQAVTIAIAGGAQTLAGKVRLIEPVIDPQTRLGKVRIALADSSQARAGMFATAEVIISERTAHALPLTAVTVEKTGTMARKIENGRVKMVPISTGVVDGEYIEIISGLKAGDDVVLKAGAYVRDGDRIKPVRQDQAAVN